VESRIGWLVRVGTWQHRCDRQYSDIRQRKLSKCERRCFGDHWELWI